MKKLYIKLDSNNICTGFHTVNKMDINGNKPPAFDLVATNYPEDFVGNMQKYVITEVDGEIVFTMRDRYDEYQTYLENFDYGDEENPNTPDSYEVWYAAL